MQAKAYEGYFDRGQFYSAGKQLRIPERRKVYVMVFDEPAQEDTSTDWVDELVQMVKEDSSEKLRMEDFPRLDFGREPITFESDGGQS